MKRKVVYVAGDGCELPDGRVFQRGGPQEIEAEEAAAFVASGAYEYADEVIADTPTPKKKGGDK